MPLQYVMYADDLICEFALRLHRSGEAKLRLRLPPQEGGGYKNLTTAMVRFDTKVRQTRQFASYPSLPIFLLANSECLSQCAEQSARSNILHRIGYSRVTDPHIEREVHA